VGRQLRAGIAFEERHELGLEEVRRGEVRRHHAEQAVPGQRRNALRHRRAAGAEVDECFGERVDERIEIEQRLHVLAGQDQHSQDTFFSQESACWFQGTRCVTPAACIRARFATYQS
jgi:hypothetical protein